MEDFTCEKCGACCWIIGCEFLGLDNLCNIYEFRPQECMGSSETNTKNACHQCRSIKKSFKARGYTPPKKTIEELVELSKHL